MPEFDRDLQSLKEEVRARSDIVEIISQVTQLKRSGKNWTGLCPFHADKKPSFSVSPLTQSYRCWSCGEKGDVFTFIQKRENVDFLDALELLAKRAGVSFERHALSGEKAGEREQMFALNEFAVRFYQERLYRSPDAQAYLAKRGILKQTQEQWDLGFASPEWEALAFALEKQRADMDLAKRAGLIKTRDTGGYYDTFRNRLMFPIHDIQGRVIAFGGRAMGDDAAKYLNSEQSPLFDKSRTLYGLTFARRKLSTDTPAVFVEGYVDVITTHQAGFTQCVATLGTSMTEEHARMLVRYSPRVIICYDADSAGIKATLRGASVWESIGVEGAEVRVARLPAGEDPDSLLRKGDTAGFQAALDIAVPRIDFQIEQAMERHDVQTDEGRQQALAEIVPLIASITTMTQRDRYIQKIAHLHPAYRFNLSRAIDSLLADVDLYQRQSQNASSPRDRGFPLTEQTNRGPLANEAPPPAYRPADSERWGKWQPDTQNIIRRNDAAGREGSGGWSQDKGNFGGSRGGGKYGRREARDPLRDYGPPPLKAPLLSGVEKAERQLLRALFSADWRSWVLGRLRAELLITSQGKALFDLAARTPAGVDGAIDALALLHKAEAAEAEHLQAAGSAPTFLNSAAKALKEMPEGASNIVPPEPETGDLHPVSTANDSETPAMSRNTSRNSAKTSEFIREVLEDSLSVMSNEPLGEAVLGDCIKRLQQHHEEQTRQELLVLLVRDDVSPEQRENYLRQFHEKMRQTRGSPPGTEPSSEA